MSFNSLTLRLPPADLELLYKLQVGGEKRHWEHCPLAPTASTLMA